ncbi:DUF1211 domain-containing protein [Oenococcus sp. UCMA 16435]|nr:DUF1211 domain-containing protein [Oenococcus sp. UCMA 16435]MDI4584282.1 DUF1211 domain-containing protein [Oenococcus sp. UCMA 14587]MDN6967023.1 DUF1211 domain-containing protein [Oenococcus sp. UCMA 17063]
MNSKKIKDRLDTFVDAILAIIATIMVLELPIKIVDKQIDFVNLFISIGVYLVSFCFLANVWYQHAVLFSEVEKVSEGIILRELILVFFLSLMPTFTRLMTEDVISITVILYGLLYLLIEFIFRWIAKDLIHSKYSNKSDMQKVYYSIYGKHNNEQTFLNIGLIFLALFLPKIALFLYLAIPIRSFLTINDDRTDFEEVGKMPTQGRKTYLDMSSKERVDFQKMMQQYRRQIHSSAGNRAIREKAWNNFVKESKKSFNINEDQLKDWFNRPERH